MKRSMVSMTIWVLIALGINSFYFINDIHAQASTQKNWVTFGVLCPTSGPIAGMGKYIVDTVNLAVEEVNTKWNPPDGGLIIKDKRYYVRYEYYDDGGDPSKSVAGFRKLVEMYKVPFVIGPFGTPQVLATMPVSKELETFLTSFSSSDKAHKMGNPYMLAVRPPSKYYGAPLAKACIERGWKKFTVLTDVSDATTSTSEEFKKEMEKLGGASLGFEIIDTKTVFDFRPMMTKFKAKNPDVIFVVAYQEPSAVMVNHAREVGYEGHILATANYNQVSLKMAGLKNSSGILAESMYWDYYLAHPEFDKTGSVTYLSNLYKRNYPSVPLADLIPTTWNPTLTFFKALEVAGTSTDTSAIQKSLDKAVKLIGNKLAIPYDGVLPSGMITGFDELIIEIQPDGSFKKVGDLVIPVDKLR
jgi:branched-chain amino acid transport system substrate-binding protein